MKRLLFLIFITIFCITGFLFAAGAFSLPSGSGLESAISLLFSSRFSGVISLAFIAALSIIFYRREIGENIQGFYLKFLAKPDYYEPCTEAALAQKVAVAEQKMTDTEQALDKFSRAIEKYARHLSSHTGAIRGLNAASHELQRGAATQNRVLMHLMNTLDKPVNTGRTPHWRVDPPPLEPENDSATPGEAKPLAHPDIPDVDRDSIPPGCARKPRKKPEKQQDTGPDNTGETAAESSPEMAIDPESLRNVQKTVREIRAKQGKNLIRQNIAAEALAAEEEILKAIRNLNAQLDESEFQE
ncbi:MAG: hypothetical protein PVG61_04100 [Dehalococcoidia bacterium]|jgi:hypothetical protein